MRDLNQNKRRLDRWIQQNGSERDYPTYDENTVITLVRCDRHSLCWEEAIQAIGEHLERCKLFRFETTVVFVDKNGTQCKGEAMMMHSKGVQSVTSKGVDRYTTATSELREK